MKLHQASEHEIEFIVPHAASFPSGEAVASAGPTKARLGSCQSTLENAPRSAESAIATADGAKFQI